MIFVWRFGPVVRTDNDATASNFIAATFIKNNQADRALPFIESVLKNDPENINAKFNKAIIFKSQGNIAGTYKLLNEILAKQKNHIPSLLLFSRTELQ